MTTHQQTIEAALARITTGYVFPERTAAIATLLRRQLADGAYQGLGERELCERVSDDLQKACPDKHLRLLYSEEPQPMDEEPEEVARARFAQYARESNYGVRRVEQLDGNIGYLDLRMIAPADLGGAATAAAMQLLATTDALVIDLRQCRGGSPEGVQLWCSYFFAGDAVHLNDIYERSTDSVRQYWTLGHLAAPRYLDRPVAVLTSDVTFSGGEELAYNLKVLERATLVGRTTRGGAHPTARFPVAPTSPSPSPPPAPSTPSPAPTGKPPASNPTSPPPPRTPSPRPWSTSAPDRPDTPPGRSDLRHRSEE
ncbi:S41 family peptidase [Kitasatospora cheerisanensis]|uniref:Peptidase S41 n=1 Tax=Kitasatospora cheerisanensis KCTC 2395 TaxID=1348663 RepID=A0A066YTT1_9ACTN|nr:S41 family peptidase [Kitasatospora cheerisanensis]KDN84632.1 peptidase S41 [Kitasatospora cheerisanensis KCTC 2395]